MLVCWFGLLAWLVWSVGLFGWFGWFAGLVGLICWFAGLWNESTILSHRSDRGRIGADSGLVQTGIGVEWAPIDAQLIRG